MAENTTTHNKPKRTFTTFKGMYNLTPSGQTVDTTIVMLSCTNDVQPIGDWEFNDYKAHTVFGTLAKKCHPGKEIKVPIVANNGTNDIITILNVNTSGEMSLPIDLTGKVYLSGINFNISDNWY